MDYTKLWDYINLEYNLERQLKYRWIQLADASHKLWKDHILNSIGNSMNVKYNINKIIHL